MTILVSSAKPIAAGVATPPAGITQPAKIPHTRRVINAARAHDHKPLAKALEDCCYGDRCGSYWCSDCRTESFKSLRTRVTSALAQFAGNHEAMRAGTRYATVVHGVVPLNLDDVRAALKSGRKILSRIPTLFPGLVLLGAWELELIDVGMLLGVDACEIKRQTVLKLLGEDQCPGKGRRRNAQKATPDTVSKAGYAVIVHFHATAVLNGNDPERVRAWMTKQWPHARQILFEQPWDQARQLAAAGFDGEATDLRCASLSRRAVELFVAKVSSYCFKSRVQFNLSWKSGGYTSAPYIPDQQLARLVQYHHTLGKKALRLSVGLAKKRRQGAVETRSGHRPEDTIGAVTDTDPAYTDRKPVGTLGASSERKSLNSGADQRCAELAIWQSNNGRSQAPTATAPGCAHDFEKGDFHVEHSATLHLRVAAHVASGIANHATTQAPSVVAGAAERRRTI